MTRSSHDELHLPTGRIWNGFDYALQVWVRGGIVQSCAHPLRMRTSGYCCNQARYAGLSILTIPGAEKREAEQAHDDPDALTRVIRRQGYIIEGELELLPPDLPVVIKLEHGKRLASTAAQAVALTRLLEAVLGQTVAEVFVPANTLKALSAHPPPRQENPRPVLFGDLTPEN